jgi:hypothetical protein
MPRVNNRGLPQALNAFEMVGLAGGGYMLLIRIFAVLLTAILLAGASCMPVHSDRPMGAIPVNFTKGPVYWNGVWCTPANLEGERELCWTLTALDETKGVLAVDRMFSRGVRPEITTLDVRRAPPKPPFDSESSWLFLNEEDAILKGTYLWALATSYGENILLIWLTDKTRPAFVELVRKGELPGRIVDKTKGRSVTLDSEVEQTLILEGLTDEHLRLIIDRMGELFELTPSFILERLGTVERNQQD